MKRCEIVCMTVILAGSFNFVKADEIKIGEYPLTALRPPILPVYRIRGLRRPMLPAGMRFPILIHRRLGCIPIRVFDLITDSPSTISVRIRWDRIPGIRLPIIR